MGLFLDENGIPVSIEMFPGNTLDHQTLCTAMKNTVDTLNLERFILIADRGMYIGPNLCHVLDQGNGYIISRSLKKSTKEDRQWTLEQDGYTTVSPDFRYKSRIVSRTVTDENGEKRKIREKVVVYWSRAFCDLEKHENQSFLDFIDKLKSNPAGFRVSAAQSKSLGRFMSKEVTHRETGEILDSRKLLSMIDEEKLTEFNELMGYYQIATSETEMDDLEIIDKYHGLTQIEDQFREMDTFVRRFIAQTGKTPGNTAVLDVQGAWTYKKLNNRSAYLAERIQRAVGGKGVRVALLLPRTKDFVLGQLAVLCAGCAMVPIDGEYPQERVRSILSDAKCAICLTTSARAGDVAPVASLVLEQVFPPDAEEEPEGNLSIDDSRLDAEGCILYTSGSTGRPKGVIHRMEMFNYPDVLVGKIPLSDGTRTLCIAGFSFVASQLDIVTPLICGGSVYIASEIERKNMETLYALFSKRRITGMFMPPAMYGVMRRLHGTLPLDYVLLAGEKVNPEDTGDTGVWELYGSTEVPAVLMHVAGSGGSGALGKPYPRVTVCLVDEDGKRVEAPGEIGEMCVSSPYMAKGYSELPEENARKFESDRLGGGERLVHTGDYMAFDEEGGLVFHGRQDRMVKIRGYRVELGEVEQAMKGCSGLDEIAVVNKKVNGGDKICCYYTGTEASPAALKTCLGERLPEYMIPEYFIYLENLLRNDRSKVDYSALKAMKTRTEEGEYEPPVTEMEKRVCKAFADTLDLERSARWRTSLNAAEPASARRF